MDTSAKVRQYFSWLLSLVLLWGWFGSGAYFWQDIVSLCKASIDWEKVLEKTFFFADIQDFLLTVDFYSIGMALLLDYW